MRAFLLTVLIAAPLGAFGCKARTTDGEPNANNTARNDKDRDPNNRATADQAATSGSDIDLTQSVRKAITSSGDLSTNAHNVKIIVDRGVVTLAGPVKSEDERTRVETIAMNVRGTAKVVNHLEVITN